MLMMNEWFYRALELLTYNPVLQLLVAGVLLIYFVRAVRWW
ncbi:hypothetical protein [Sideroxyarcus sp. TK5]